MSELLEEVKEIYQSYEKPEYQAWCHKRISTLTERIKSHARKGKNYIEIRDSKCSAEQVYEYFAQQGFKIYHGYSFIDGWEIGDKIEKRWDSYQVKISWEIEDE